MKNELEEIQVVSQLCEEIGYGHLMCLASVLWRKKMIDAGQPVSGVFIPALRDAITPDWQEVVDADLIYYDKKLKAPDTI